MPTISTGADLTRFVSSLPDSPPLILIGEMHGSQQNAPFMHKIGSILLKRYKQLAFCFEWPLTEHELGSLRAYTNNGARPEELPAFFLDSDGRFTEEHTSLLRWIREVNKAVPNTIDVYTFDNPKFQGPDFEKEMAQSLLTYHSTHPNHCLLIETGVIHARKEFSEGDAFMPMGHYLKKGTADSAVISFFLQYKHGFINVEGAPRDVTQAAAQISGPGNNFDAVYSFPNSDANRNIQNLTDVMNML